MREIAPIGPVIDYSERVVTIAQNIHRPPEDRSAALQAVFTEMGRGLWTRDVLTAWTYLIANLTHQAQIPGNDAPGRRIIGEGTESEADAAWRQVGARLIDTIHAGDRAALHSVISSAFALPVEQMWQLMWRLAELIIEPLEDGGPDSYSVTSAAAANDATRYTELVTGLLTEDTRILRLVQRWVTIAAPACTSASDVFPGDASLTSYLQSVIDGEPLKALASQTAWILTATQEQVIDDVYPLAQIVHDVLNSIGGAARLRASLILHTPEFRPDKAALCRRAAAIVAAAANGSWQAMHRYISATLRTCGRDGMTTLVGAWMDLLAERLHYFDGRAFAVISPAGVPEAMISAIDDLDRSDEAQRTMAQLLDAAARLRRNEPHALDDLSAELARRSDDSMQMLAQLAVLMGQVLRAGEDDHGPRGKPTSVKPNPLFRR